MSAQQALVGALLGLVALYAIWYGRAADALASLAFFAVPPLLLGLAVWRGHRRAGFWAGMFALIWFSHGVLVAWTRRPEWAYAAIEIGLSLLAIAAASVPGLRARRAARRVRSAQ
ncbi:MAG TPA: DUF2069 domain-containing protein [Xanthomonadaceae bacterium]|nr:DUF2069 domain-containing protein [Xanthomonadaceae bacterium]